MLKDQCDNVHFKETVTLEEGIQFDNRLQQGPATPRNALLLLESMHFLESVIFEAEKERNFLTKLSNGYLFKFKGNNSRSVLKLHT